VERHLVAVNKNVHVVIIISAYLTDAYAEPNAMVVVPMDSRRKAVIALLQHQVCYMQ
jgi:hypothetical protein